MYSRSHDRPDAVTPARHKCRAGCDRKRKNVQRLVQSGCWIKWRVRKDEQCTVGNVTDWTLLSGVNGDRNRRMKMYSGWHS
jgi:hypothetical protein